MESGAFASRVSETLKTMTESHDFWHCDAKHQVAYHRDPRTTKQLQPRYLEVDCREDALEESGGTFLIWFFL